MKLRHDLSIKTLQRVSDPARLDLVRQTNDITYSEELDAWGGWDFNSSSASVALLAAEIYHSTREPNLIKTINLLISNQMRSLNNQSGPPPPLALYGGLAGTFLAIDSVCEATRNFVRLRESLGTLLIDELMRDRAETEFGILGTNGPERFDAINGGAGVLQALLSASPLCTAAIPGYSEAMGVIAGQLIERARNIESETGFYIPPESRAGEMKAHLYPRGYVDLGLAHGIAGPMIALSNFSLSGHNTSGLLGAIRTLLEYLLYNSSFDDYGAYWPIGVDVSDRANSVRVREGWCYGAPGILAALYQAGRAVGDKDIQQYALTGFISMFSRYGGKETQLLSSVLCHGIGGLLVLSDWLLEQSEDTRFEDLGAEYINMLTQQFDENRPLGFYEIDEGRPFDNPTFLIGATGSALAALRLTTPGLWRRHLMLSSFNR